MFLVTGHQQNVGMTRRGDEAQAEALEIVEGVVERVDLELAGIASRHRPRGWRGRGQLLAGHAAEICRELGEGSLFGAGGGSARRPRATFWKRVRGCLALEVVPE